MTDKTLDDLNTLHSDMLAQAIDLGVNVPDDLTLEFSTVETGRTVCDSLDKLLTEARAKLAEQQEQEAGEGEQGQNTAPEAKGAKSTARKSSKKKKSATKPKGQDTTTEATEEGETMATTAKKAKTTAKKAPAKKAAKASAGKKAATDKARSGNVARAKLSVAGITFGDNSKIAIADKAYIEAQSKSKSAWAARLKKVVAHAGKKVADFNGPKSDIKWAVVRGAIKIV